MNGAHVDAQLLAFVERRLPPAERARVEAHLANCGRCRGAAAELFETVDHLEALPSALRALPSRAAQQWPSVWARVAAARRPAVEPASRPRPAWPQVSVYLSVVTSFLVFVSVLPSGGAAVPASVTAGVAVGPQHTQPATVAFQSQTGAAHSDSTAASVAGIEPTLAGTEAIQPVPIPTPVPGP